MATGLIFLMSSYFSTRNSCIIKLSYFLLFTVQGVEFTIVSRVKLWQGDHSINTGCFHAPSALLNIQLRLDHVLNKSINLRGSQSLVSFILIRIIYLQMTQWSLTHLSIRVLQSSYESMLDAICRGVCKTRNTKLRKNSEIIYHD